MQCTRCLFLAILLTYLTATAQNHIGVPHTKPHGTSRICWGYAIGRAGSSICDPTTLIPDENGIDATYFNHYEWSEVNSLQYGDILYWPGTHAAYVVEVPKDQQGNVIVDNIRVDHTWASATEVYSYVTLTTARQQLGSLGYPSKFCRKKQVSITVTNSFGGGDVKIGPSAYSSGSTVPVSWWGTVSLEAIDQNYSNIWRQWYNWEKTGEGNPTSQNPRTIYAAASDAYTANFTDWSDISFTNSLPGASGGTITVWDTSRNAPGTVRMPLNTTFNISASSYLEINEIQFTFSHWSGASSSSSASLSSQSATEHKSYTANFTAKPLPPTNVLATGSVGNPVRIEWTDNPNSNVTQYQIWRRVKPLGGQQGEPEHIGTVNSGVEECTDYTFTVTSSYTDYLLTYDVRSYYQAGGSYSDPNWSVTEFGEVGARRAPGEQGNMKIGSTLLTEFAISVYPNPFNPSTTISYQLVEEADVHLQIFDLLGRQVAELVKGMKSAGSHSVVWNGKDRSGNEAPTGIYLVRFQAFSPDGNETFRKTGKLLLTK